MKQLNDNIGKKITDIYVVPCEDFTDNHQAERLYLVFEDDSVLAVMPTLPRTRCFGLDIFHMSRYGEVYNEKERFLDVYDLFKPYIGATLCCTWDVIYHHLSSYVFSFDGGLPWLLCSVMDNGTMSFFVTDESIQVPGSYMDLPPRVLPRKRKLQEYRKNNNVTLLGDVEAVHVTLDALLGNGTSNSAQEIAWVCTFLDIKLRTFPVENPHPDMIQKSTKTEAIVLRPLTKTDEMSVQVLNEKEYRPTEPVVQDHLLTKVLHFEALDYHLLPGYNNINGRLNLFILPSVLSDGKPLLMRSQDGLIYVHRLRGAMPLV